MLVSVFNAESKPAAPHAGKTMVYGRGPLYEQFMNEGLKYNTNMFVFANDENMEEQKVFLRPNNLRVPVPEPASEFIDEVTETTSEQAVSVHSEDGEEDLDIYNMKKYAKKVTIGKPSTSKEDSDSDSGTKVHSRTTNKSVDPRKEIRREQKKKMLKVKRFIQK